MDTLETDHDGTQGTCSSSASVPLQTPSAPPSPANELAGENLNVESDSQSETTLAQSESDLPERQGNNPTAAKPSARPGLSTSSADCADSPIVQGIPVTIAVLLNLFCYAVAMGVVCGKLLDPMGAKVACIVCLTLLNLMAYACYVRIILADPGSVPSDWHVAGEHLVMDEETCTRVVGERDGTRRFCAKCMLFKPDRAHHCGTCKRCILRYDHHCPWVLNCVGYGNHKFFLLFLLYSMLVCIFFFGLSVPYVAQYAQDELVDQSLGPWVCALLGISAILLPSIFGLFVTHMILICTNKTTIEMNFPPVAPAPTVKKQMFDVGLKANWTSIMGSEPLLWLLPVHGRRALNGTEYPVAWKVSEEV